MPKSLKLLLALFAVLTLSSFAHADPVVKVVTFQPSVTKEQRIAAIEQAGGKVLRELALVDGVEAEFPTAGNFAVPASWSNVKTLMKGLRGVMTIEEDKPRNWLVSANAAMPAVGDFLRRGAVAVPGVGAARPVSAEAASKMPWGIERVNAAGAWSRTMGAGVRVAVLDTGIDATHPALKANFKGGFNSAQEGGSYKDGHGHGTHVAGTVAGASKEVVGVAPQASLYAVKVLDDEGNGTFASIIKGLEWAVENRMQVVNMSLGGPHSEALEAAVKKTLAAGVVIVAAAGNDPEAEVSAPARYDGVLAISASASNDSLAFFSTTGPQVDFIAPGHQVLSSWPGGGTNTISGTSMATPHVAGLAALAVSLGARGPAGVQRMLAGAAKPLAGLKPEQQGAGMIDAGRLGGTGVLVASAQ
ncbi:hypothetical protein EPO15_11405 [bacterium]|nr:MAG: hypothetical protein EPO15_11405 [bacterium]